MKILVMGLRKLEFLWAYILMLMILIDCAKLLKFVTHPDAGLDMEQKIKRHGYPVEVHNIITKDNYKLSVHRIPSGRSPTNYTTRSPVLIVHGMGGSPEVFLILGKYRALPYYLADRGFDIWLLGTRGAKHSQGHTFYDLNNDKQRYWQFSFHEIGIYDLPATIDYITKKTNQSIFYIGHSAGTTSYFVMSTERPEYNDKVKIAAMYAPTILLRYMDYPVVYLFSYVVDVLEAFFSMINNFEGVPFIEELGRIGSVLCTERTYFLQFCVNMLSVIGTHESKIFDKELTPVIFSTAPSRISSMLSFHMMQIIKSGKFRQYDYGSEGNLKKYKTRYPPNYDLKKSVAPVALFYAENDQFSTIKGAEETIAALPNVIFDYKVPYEFFNHIDFVFGTNASELVYHPTYQLFKDYDKGKLINYTTRKRDGEK